MVDSKRGVGSWRGDKKDTLRIRTPDMPEQKSGQYGGNDTKDQIITTKQEEEAAGRKGRQNTCTEERHKEKD